LAAVESATSAAKDTAPCERHVGALELDRARTELDRGISIFAHQRKMGPGDLVGKRRKVAWEPAYRYSSSWVFLGGRELLIK
jgi:hypothetical protein